MKAKRAIGAAKPDEVLQAIKSHIGDFGFAPTVRELASLLNCGHSTIQRAVAQLEKDRQITFQKKIARGIVPAKMV
jgi:DNA-binding transcriptional regulator YhcF (GntR family)